MQNDLRDATLLADLLRMGSLPESWISPPSIRELRELVRYRHKLSHVVEPEPSIRSGSRVRWQAFAVAAVALATDVAAKTVGVSMLTDGPIDLPGPLDLRLVRNSGVAFGVGSGLPVGLVIGVTAAVTILLAVLVWRGGFPPLAGGLILGGAVANVVDRLGDGAVIDLFDLGWWPTFNLADIWITLGVAAVILVAAKAPAEPSETAI